MRLHELRTAIWFTFEMKVDQFNRIVYEKKVKQQQNIRKQSTGLNEYLFAKHKACRQFMINAKLSKAM